MKAAVCGLEEIRPHVDTLIVIPNERLLKISAPETQLLDAFRESDNVLRKESKVLRKLLQFQGLLMLTLRMLKQL